MPNNLREPAQVEVDSDSVKHVRPGLGWSLFRAALAVFVGSFMLIALHNVATWYDALSLRDFIQTVFSYGVLVAPVLAILSVVASTVSIPPVHSATLTASEDGLFMKDRHGHSKSIPRDRLVSGLVVPADKRLELFLNGGDKLIAAIPNEYDAQALLSALGLDSARRRVAVKLGSVPAQLTYGCLMIPLTFFGMIMLLTLLDVPDRFFKTMLPGLFPLMLLLAIRAARPVEVIVGTDGVGLRRAWTRRFIPYSALRSAEIDDDSNLVLKMLSGKEITLNNGDEPARRALSARIREAMQAQGDGSAEGRAELDLLELRGRSLHAWRDALKGLAARPGDYRRAGIPEEMLLSVIEDPDAAPERRIGAAVALRASGRKDAAPRIRVAAEACASERVRVALERAAEDELDDATLELAMKEAEKAKRA